MIANTLNTAKYARLVAKAQPVVIRTKTDYKRLIGVIDELMEKGESKMSPEESRLLELMSKLVADYEKSVDPIERPGPRDMLEQLMEGRGWRQTDLIPFLGSKSRVSEVLAGKRELSKAQARALAEEFKVPLEFFI